MTRLYVKLFEDWEPDEDWQEPKEDDLISSGLANKVKPEETVIFKIDPKYRNYGLATSKLFTNWSEGIDLLQISNWTPDPDKDEDDDSDDEPLFSPD